MANADGRLSVLPLHCPKCAHEGATVFVSSYTVVTLVCLVCLHTWAAEVAVLPEGVRKLLGPVARRPA
mgnify:CR=1 FL=1